MKCHQFDNFALKLKKKKLLRRESKELLVYFMEAFPFFLSGNRNYPLQLFLTQRQIIICGEIHGKYEKGPILPLTQCLQFHPRWCLYSLRDKTESYMYNNLLNIHILVTYSNSFYQEQSPPEFNRFCFLVHRPWT